MGVGATVGEGVGAKVGEGVSTPLRSTASEESLFGEPADAFDEYVRAAEVERHIRTS